MTYTNPVIRGFNPDPSVCRVGDDYYLATSSFEYFPGIPLYHSRDLVNWELMGNCLSRPGMLPFEGVADSGGVWAPTIRYREETGRFYLTTCFHGGEAFGRRNCIIHTDDIYGQWSDPVFVAMGGIDPSLLFDTDADGVAHCYYCTNMRLDKERAQISMAEIDPDNGELKSSIRAIWEGMVDSCGRQGGWLEAPHLYHIGDYYYVLGAEGGTNFGHMVTAARTPVKTGSIWGPYENCPYNPILTSRHDSSKAVQCSGHGDVVDDGRGAWYMVHLATRPAKSLLSHMGRETFLAPVRWIDDWPVAGDSGTARLVFEAPKDSAGKAVVQKTLPSQYTVHDIGAARWVFPRGQGIERFERDSDGSLHITPHTTALFRQPDMECSFQARLLMSGAQAGDEAGLTAYLATTYYYRIGLRKEAGSADTGGDYIIIVEKCADDFHETAFRMNIPGLDASAPGLDLQITADKLFYHFRYSLDGAGWVEACKLSTRFLYCELTDRCFTGAMLGVYAKGIYARGVYAKGKGVSVWIR
jgi:alpha-N-arabinofuranosidase